MSGGIIVLGMHRSGTSLVSEMLHRWGAFGRVEDCLPSDQWNARGYWELSPLVDLNTRLLKEAGAAWDCPPRQKDDQRLADLAAQPSYRGEAMGLLVSMKVEQNGSWFWKDPRLSLLLPFWQELWSDVRYVICVRDPFEICRSLLERDDLSFPVSILLWQRYMLSILEWTRKGPAIVVSYSALLQNPADECARLSLFLQNSNASDRSMEAAKEMRKAVDKELRHFRTDNHHTPLLSRSQKELHGTLERLASSSGANQKLNLERYSLPGSWRSLLKANLLLLRCQRRWNRLFAIPEAAPPAVSSMDAIEISHAIGLAGLDSDMSLNQSAYMSAVFGKLVRSYLDSRRSLR